MALPSTTTSASEWLMPSPSTYSTLTQSHSFMTNLPSPLCPHLIASYMLSTFSLAPSQTHLKPSTMSSSPPYLSSKIYSPNGGELLMVDGFRVVDAVTKHLLYSDTVTFLHDYLTQPTVSPYDCIVHDLNFLSCAISEAPKAIHHEQLSAISKLRDIFSNWKASMTLTPPTHDCSPDPA